ncbi:2-(3-amino-3-carboxypropyl)histidine synthase subunit 2 [Anopheles darlingi]|uniref:2-(3-amino-3-carboxypropyl)histidine synthase subunit 2 n=1 Tax=Anopheles darlingi TaxID=43151 RepID=UPI0001E95CE0|nr:2-(3-amino-3-carboxypropyl)histidine synthase subunit 2 [Anopheles darlingi]XP_049538001.1 2-(3-amino-3-carboxypropyl)histidine synthase subunit 2 [Anopheles darlingi]
MTSAFSSGDSIAENQAGAAGKVERIALEYVWGPDQLRRCQAWIEQKQLQRIALQLPDEALCHSVRIASDLQELPVGQKLLVFVLGDTSYGSCCVDEIAASHASADGIIHFGHACLSKVVRIPTLHIFYRYPVQGDDLLQALSEKFEDRSSPFSIFYDVAYEHALMQLKERIVERFPNAWIAQLAQADEKPDVLCWKIPPERIVSEHPAVYVGHHNLSFFNSSVAIAARGWYLLDVKAGKVKLEQNDELQEAKWMKRRNYAILRCRDATSLGIVVGTLSFDGYLEVVDRLQRLAKARGVRTYLFSVGKVNVAKLANFSEIECFVLVGCPENDIFLSRDFYRPLLSVFEAEIALNPGWRAPQTEIKYTTNFLDVLPSGRLYLDDRDHQHEQEETDVSLITGKIRYIPRLDEDQAVAATTQELALKGRNEVATISSADTFANRSWQGLEQRLGQDAPAVIEEGRSGLPIKYENDP